jgi:hypothetical protein
VIGNVGLAISRAPIVIVGLERYVQRCVALISITHASAARRLAAAVVVRDDVVFAIERVVTSPYPGDSGHRSPRGTGILSSPTAPTQISINRAVAPVIATAWIVDLPGFRVRGRASGDRQQGRGRCAHQQGPQVSDDAASRSALGQRTGRALHHPVHPPHGLTNTVGVVPISVTERRNFPLVAS